MEYIILIATFFTLGHLIMGIKSLSETRKTEKVCKNLSSKLKG
jgi:hypothetical protein